LAPGYKPTFLVWTFLPGLCVVRFLVHLKSCQSFCTQEPFSFQTAFSYKEALSTFLGRCFTLKKLSGYNSDFEFRLRGLWDVSIYVHPEVRMKTLKFVGAKTVRDFKLVKLFLIFNII
jgi:hypothetical protein